MSKVCVPAFSVSVDGYSAGPNQSEEHPLGVGGKRLHEWAFATKTFQTMFGNSDGETGIDNDMAAMRFARAGVEIMGRNKFGPIRGEWGNSEWRGWWGETPPFHHPCIVLTHFEHEPMEMEGGTTFYFETGGIDVALKHAEELAGDKDILIGGGANTVQQYLEARLIDELHIVIAPVVLGSGERFFDNVDDISPDYGVRETIQGERATHVFIDRLAK